MRICCLKFTHDSIILVCETEKLCFGRFSGWVIVMSVCNVFNVLLNRPVKTNFLGAPSSVRF